MASYNLMRPLTSIRFEDKVQFPASQDLSFARSKWFTLPETESRHDVWSIKPPDFSLKLYRSLLVPQKKERKTHSHPALSQPGETKRRTRIFLPNLLHENYQRKEPPQFITKYRPPGALESELMFVRTGKLPSEPYKNPKPHDFRPLDEDLPDMLTTYEKDPGNLKLKLKHLDINCSSKDARTRMDTFKPAEPRWDAGLILPQTPWPPKSASFTRHRRRRGAYSAFLDRVEEKLSRSWENRS
uniref:putative uncharacterized protein C7orf78 homolog n=1 Tax=Semicossyphus pulcher TaxID=241346 RepID=UPI0037E80B1A